MPLADNPENNAGVFYFLEIPDKILGKNKESNVICSNIA
jgi:hypothetical protein